MDVEKGMVANFSDWMPGSPFRRPEWRWLRANFLVQYHRRVDRRIDDDAVVDLRDYLKIITGSCPRRLSPTNECIQSAVALYEEMPAARRLMIEAYLLSGERFEAVAAR